MRILIADDSAVSRQVLVQQLVGLGYTVSTVEDGDQAWSVLSEDTAPELAILDWMMPGMEGIEVCRRVRELSNDRYTYLMLVTMKERPEDVAAGLAAGADDFVIKPFDPIELQARVQVGERVVRYAERLRRANEDLTRLATTDELTRLYNRAAILERLDQEAGRHLREDRDLSVLMVDIDSFKECNDSFGHAAGDAVLRLTGTAIQSGCRIYDTLGRYGGDEFLVVLPGADEPAALAVAERIRERVEAATVATGSDRLRATVSIGSATWKPGGETTLQQVVRAADAALYDAKAGGRNTVCAASDEQYDRARAATVVD